MNRIDVLNKAIELTGGDRNRDYGDPYENLRHIADIFNAITGHGLSASDVATLQIAVKLARARTSPLKSDHYVDMAAYMAIRYECEQQEAEI